MKGKLDGHQIELYKIALLEALCRIHSITEEQLNNIARVIREDDK